MTYSLSESAVPPLRVALETLSALLARAETHATEKKIDPAVLLNMRLSPDMFPLTRQVQIATDMAKNGLSRLADVTPPRFEDKETTIPELKDRIARVLAHIDTLDAAVIDAATARAVTFPMGPEKSGRMTGADYARHFLLPNVYFHLVAAYAILRHAGVPLGKNDYLGNIPLEKV